MAFDREVGEIGADFVRAHFGRVAFMVEEDEAFDVVDARFFGAPGWCAWAADPIARRGHRR